MLFRVLVFILLLVIGYVLSSKVRSSRIGTSMISAFLLIALAGFLLLSKRIFSVFGFSFYLILVVLGLLTGFLFGVYQKNRVQK